MALDFRVIKPVKIKPLASGGQGPETPDRISRIGQRQDQPEKKYKAVHRQQPTSTFFRGRRARARQTRASGQSGQGRGK